MDWEEEEKEKIDYIFFSFLLVPTSGSLYLFLMFGSSAHLRSSCVIFGRAQLGLLSTKRQIDRTISSRCCSVISPLHHSRDFRIGW